MLSPVIFILETFDVLNCTYTLDFFYSSTPCELETAGIIPGRHPIVVLSYHATAKFQLENCSRNTGERK